MKYFSIVTVVLLLTAFASKAGEDDSDILLLEPTMRGFQVGLVSGLAAGSYAAYHPGQCSLAGIAGFGAGAMGSFCLGNVCLRRRCFASYISCHATPVGFLTAYLLAKAIQAITLSDG